MKIVVPASGKGERFRAAGYDTPKPLIPVYGEPMIDRVIRSLNICETRDKHIVVVNFDSRLINHDVVELDRATVGAAETVLLALQAREHNKDTSMLLVDCDAIYHSDIITRFRALELQTEVRAAVLSFIEEEPERHAKPKYSYVKVDENGDIVQIAEKVRVGPLANTGAYWFASTYEFVEVADNIINNRHFQQGEAYISCVLDEYLKRDMKAKVISIKADEYSNVGTPECLERYLSSAGRAFLFDLDGPLVNTTDAYVHA